MNSGNNRFSLLGDEEFGQFEDEIESPSVSIAVAMTKRKSKKKKSKKLKQDVPDVVGDIDNTTKFQITLLPFIFWRFLMYILGYVFLRSKSELDSRFISDEAITMSTNSSDSRGTPDIPVIDTVPIEVISTPSPKPTSANPIATTRKTSSGPPPAYTPRPEFVVSRSGSEPTVRITADGSPMLPKSEFVQVGVDIRWPDKNSKYTVKRGTKEKDLKLITPVKYLLDYGREADIKISPPRSAKSDTKVHVDSSYEMLFNRMKEDFADSMDTIVDKKVQKSLKERTRYEREFSSYLWMRTLQDLVYYTMSTRMNEEDVKAWSSFEILVDEYVDNNTVDILTTSDLQHLRNSTDRAAANSHAHPDLKDRKAAELRWKALDARLEEDGMIEERERYRRYYEFAKRNLL